MAKLKTPMFGSYNNRSFTTVSGKDQFAKGCVLTPIINHQSQSASYYVEKRSGLVAVNTPAAGAGGKGCYYSPSTDIVYSAFDSSTNYAIYSGTTNCGIVTATGEQLLMNSETIINGITFILITAVSNTGGTGWFLASDAVATTAYTADGNNSTTITDIKIAGVNSVAGLYVGQKLTAASNIVAGSRIVSINAGAFSAVLDTATTGGAFNDLAITKERIAKIIDADFPTDIVGYMVELDGYVAVMTLQGRVYNSDLNSIVSWTGSNYLSASKVCDQGRGLSRYKNYISAFGSSSIEFLYNAGNPSGSPFNSADSCINSRAAGITLGKNLTPAFDNVYWVGGDNCLYCFAGNAAKKLTTLGTSLRGASSLWLSSFPYNFKNYISISTTRPTGSSTVYLYCPDDDTYVDFGLGAVIAFPTFNPTAGTIYLTMSGVGIVYSLNDNNGSSSVFRDDGATYTMSIQLGTDMGTYDMKTYNAVRLVGDTQASGTLDVSWSDDDGLTFSAPVSMDMTKDLKQITRCGSGHGERKWKFEHSANTPFRAKYLEFDYTV